MSLASYRSVISTLRKCQKELFVLNIFDFEAPFSAKLPVYFSNLGINQILSFCGELCSREKTFLFLAPES